MLSLFFLVYNRKWKRILLLIFHHQSHIWQNSSSRCCQPIKLQDSLKCNISRKKWMMKFVFCIQINIKVLYKLILSFWVCATRHVQSTQNKKFAYLCNISSKAWGMKLIFCLQINTKVFYKLIVSLWLVYPGMPKVPKTIRLQYLCNISRNMWRMNLVFCLQISVKGFFKLLLSF